MRYFVAVAEELHFRRAAERLHISTPSLSQQIKAVEREIGGLLLIRSPDGVSLTAAGEAFLRSARTVLAAADEAVSPAAICARHDLRRAIGPATGPRPSLGR